MRVNVTSTPNIGRKASSVKVGEVYRFVEPISNGVMSPYFLMLDPEMSQVMNLKTNTVFTYSSTHASHDIVIVEAVIEIKDSI